jgi:zinc protease
LDVLSGLITGGRGTALDDRLYYQDDLATRVGGWTHNGRLGGEFVLYAAADNRHLEEILKATDEVIAEIQTEGVTPEDVARVVAGWRSAFVRELEDRSGLAGHLGDCVVTWGTADCRADEMRRYLAVTPADVQRVAQTWLGPNRVILSVVSPGEERLAVPDSVPVVPP